MKKRISSSVCVNLVVLCLLFSLAGCKGEKNETAATMEPGKGAAPSSAPPPAENAEPEGAEEDVASTGNSPPRIESLTLSPEALSPGTPVKAVVTASDEDFDDVALIYRWMINDVPFPDEEGDTLNTEGLKKGDKISVYVTPSDGTVKGTTKGVALVIMNRTPEITSSFPQSGISGSLAYQVEATDPDGDTLKYVLDKAPPGMEIDPATGKLTWDLPSDGIREKVHIRIRVTDGDASAIQEINIAPPQ